MGRRKIAIEPITEERNRSVTFLKRKGRFFCKCVFDEMLTCLFSGFVQEGARVVGAMFGRGGRRGVWKQQEAVRVLLDRHAWDAVAIWKRRFADGSVEAQLANSEDSTRHRTNTRVQKTLEKARARQIMAMSRTASLPSTKARRLASRTSCNISHT
jgi:hypothetical protein